MRNVLRHIWHIPRKFICALISLYQATLSPDHGPLRHLYTYGYCRHEPTCSDYAKRVVTERGAIVGSLLAGRRILTCHPWKKPSEEKILKMINTKL